MNELNELRDQAYENSLIYKEKTKKIHDSKIKNRIFNIGEQVLLFNSRLKIFLGKLKTRWTRPFIVAQVFTYGTIELSQTDGPNFKVTDKSQKVKNQAKRTKYEHEIERVREIKAEGVFIFNRPTRTHSLGQVRIYQKSQENRKKWASTDTRTEECTKAGSKAMKKLTLSQAVKGKSNHGQQKSTIKRQNP
ncbi:hypothetical protein Tco_1006030 [Tanacetum coccineum]|uniref:Reverse transcriptase domain-containing protein n=1 Tax=Tanacetum coccineum TaxID=301880 RepID=A0ABQ5FIX3_9ASTR